MHAFEKCKTVHLEKTESIYSAKSMLSLNQYNFNCIEL